MANDATRFLKAGYLMANDNEPLTIADDARTVSLGRHNWEVLSEGWARIVEVPEEYIREGVSLLFLLANFQSRVHWYPTCRSGFFRGRSVCLAISEANV